MGSPMPGSKRVVLAPKPPKKVTPNNLVVDPRGGLRTNNLVVDPQGGPTPNKLRVDPFPTPKPYASIKKTSQVNKLYKTY
jgi:hypothetical protein